MSALAVLLIAVGCADICAVLTDRRWPALLAGPLVVAGFAALGALWQPGDIALMLWAATISVTWVSLGAQADRTGEHRGRALTVFAAGVAAPLLLAGWASPVAGPAQAWLHWVGADHLDPGHVLTLVGVAVQLVTANRLVRLLLGSIGSLPAPGAGASSPSDRLKGGRLLGPMERLLIVGLGVSGELGAASLVVAAKSIIRFPELNAQREISDGVGIDEVTEYFLVGSFASWLFALAGLTLATT